MTVAWALLWLLPLLLPPLLSLQRLAPSRQTRLYSPL
jgi:hypothetical protein